MLVPRRVFFVFFQDVWMPQELVGTVPVACEFLCWLHFGHNKPGQLQEHNSPDQTGERNLPSREESNALDFSR